MPSNEQSSWDVAIVGGGVCGLAAAWRARARGLTVTLVDRGPLAGATSAVAAGMIAPVSEADPQEGALRALGLECARRWPSFADELADVSGIEVGYRDSGTLIVARDPDGAAALERELALRERLGLAARALPPSRARELEPSLAPSLRGAVDIPGDHAVDPEALGAALAVAVERAGATLRPGAELQRVLVEDGRAAGLQLAGGEHVRAERVLIAAGPWSGAVPGIPAAAQVPVRPVKGQILRLRDPGHDPAAPLLERVIRHERGYIVPRGDGRYAVGATMEERGFDTSVTALAVHELLRHAADLVPGVLECILDAAVAGLRPGSPDNTPILGESPLLPGLHWATGHHRNGILLAPATGDLLAAELAGEPEAIPAELSPARFAEVTA